MRAFLADADWAPRSGGLLSADEGARKRAYNGSQAWKNPRLAVADVPVPAAGRDDLLIKVSHCGICGSDTHTYETDTEGYIIFSGLAQLPCILGHEFTGEVVEVGSGVRGFAKGDIVTSESVMWCGTCVPCRTGMPNQCEHVELMGLSAPGAFAEYTAVNAKYCWKLNSLEERYAREDVLKVGTLVEPIGCAYNGLFISAGGYLPGAHAVVYGAGPIGLGAVMLLKNSGAASITAVDIVGQRLDIARKLGADFVLDGRDMGAVEARIMEITGGWGADMQVEAAGARSTMRTIQKLAAKRGKIVYLGRAEASAAMELNGMVSGAIDMVGSRGHSGYGIFPNIIKLLQHGRLAGALDIVTSVFPFAEIAQAFAASSKRQDGKILIQIG